MTQLRDRPLLRCTARVGVAGVIVVATLLGFALVLGLVEGGWSPLRTVDVGVDAHLNSFFARHPDAVSFWKAVSTVGQPVTFETLAVVGAVALWLRGMRRLAMFTAATVLGGVLLNTIAKDVIDRARPLVGIPLDHARGTSFPSGHAMASWVAALTLLVLVHHRARRPIVLASAVLGLLSAVAIGSSRLALGVHYPSDILGAWLLGTAWVVAMAAASRAMT